MQEFWRFGLESGMRIVSATPLSTELLALLRGHLLPALIVVQDLLALLGRKLLEMLIPLHDLLALCGWHVLEA